MAIKRIIIFFIFTGIFSGVYAAGSQSDVTEEEIAETLAYFNEIIMDIDAFGIFSHNATIALPMFIPGFGAAWGLFAAYSTGFAFAAISAGTPELSELNPLAVLLTPFGLMELAAYSIGMSRSALIIEKLVKRQSILKEKKAILIEIGIVVGLLLVGGIVEYEMIKTSIEAEASSITNTLTDVESKSSNLDEFFELELLLVIGGDIKNPTDLAIGDSGNIYVADYRNKRIQIFNSLGQLIQGIELKGSPHGITLDKHENIYVTEWWDFIGVEKFTKAGKPATGFQIEDQSVFGLPSDIVTDPDGIVYVLEHRNLNTNYGKNAGIHKLGVDGTYLEFIPIPNSVINDSSKFGLMTMDKDGYLYLVDQLANNIIELNPSNGDARILTLIDFNQPNSVTFNADGYMFIADSRPLDLSRNGTIHIFDEYHQLVGTIGEWGKADGQLSGNHGLEFDKDGNMYVLDYGNHRIQVFHIASEMFGESISEEPEAIGFSLNNSSNQCELEPDPGMCKAYFPKYYFDKETNSCEEFIYGGCGGVVPFDTLEQCSQQCTKNP